MNKKKYKIFLTGGGTAGSVSPLLAVAEELIEQGKYSWDNFLWLGTKNGPEKKMVEEFGINFLKMPAGKFRRYFSWQNIIDPIFVLIAFLKSLYLLIKYKPRFILSAGSFVSVPIVWASFFTSSKSFIHQQDYVPGLANKLMGPFANTITVTLEKSLKDYGDKAIWTGNPVRKNNSKNKLHDFKNDLPTILIMGGGTGADFINNLVYQNIEKLNQQINIIHIYGKNKGQVQFEADNYRAFEFLNKSEIYSAYFQSDLIISRAGMGSLTEIAENKKPSIIIPIPDSHQEYNAEILKEKNAALIFSQSDLKLGDFANNILNNLNNKKIQEGYKENIQKVFKANARETYVELLR